jgi:hypothetical protein
MPALSPAQINKVLFAYCKHRIDSKTFEELRDYAINAMADSYSKNPGVWDTDLSMLIEDMGATMEEEAFPFLNIECGIPSDLADRVLADHDITL